VTSRESSKASMRLRTEAVRRTTTNTTTISRHRNDARNEYNYGMEEDGDGKSNGKNRGMRSTKAFMMFTLLIAGGCVLFLLDETLGTKGKAWKMGSMAVMKDPFTGSGPVFTPHDSSLASEEVHHGFEWSVDRKFVAIDRYIVKIDGKETVAVLGDGTIPLKFKRPNIVVPLIDCEMGGQMSKSVRVVPMKGHKRYQDHYNTKKKYPFSTNGDFFKSLIIYCTFESLSPDVLANPLTIKSDTPEQPFSLTVSSPFVMTGRTYAPTVLREAPVPATGLRAPGEEYSSVLCLCPMYNIKGARWLTEYLEYMREIGVTHVHLYSYDDLNMEPLKSVLAHYKKHGYVTPHDWSHKASQGFTDGATYEHAKWSAMTDCWLRTRGAADFAIFSDVDELIYAPVHSSGLIYHALRECDKTLRTTTTKMGCSFNSHTMTSIFTKLSEEELQAEKEAGGLLLQRYAHEEAKALCPWNCRCKQISNPDCRKFHYGRQKYMIKTGDESISPFVLWTHAPWRDYSLADVAMSILPSSVVHVRHYQGHWYINSGSIHNVKEKYSPLPAPVIERIKKAIANSPDLIQAMREYPGNDGLDFIEPIERDAKYHHKIGEAISLEDNEGFARYECSPEEAAKQEDRIRLRFKEWWSHSACPDQVWMEQFPELMALPEVNGRDDQPVTVLDIGCNKGYTSADFFDILSPRTDFNAHTLHKAINDVARDHNTTYKRSCGACGDCTRDLSKNRVRNVRVNIHCFEPSPATYDMLMNVDKKLSPEGKSGGRALWFIHNKGLHNKSGLLAWHKACKNAVGDELCTIVSEDTPDAIKVEVTTVDDFSENHLKPSASGGQPLIHMLKIDAEGLDPAVLRGSADVLKKGEAVMVMFEFNPGLRDKKPPYGMWGVARGLTKLLEVTDWLDTLSYDCYLDSRVDGPKGVKAPPLYRITGNCIRQDPRILGWSNVICASRKFPGVAGTLLDLAKLVNN